MFFIRGVVGLSEDVTSLKLLHHLPDHALGGPVGVVLSGSQSSFKPATLRDTSQWLVSGVSASLGLPVIHGCWLANKISYSFAIKLPVAELG